MNRFELNNHHIAVLQKAGASGDRSQINQAWQYVGDGLGFDPKTVKPSSNGEGKNIVYAVPLPNHIATVEPPKKQVVEIEPLKSELLDVNYFQDWFSMEVVDEESQKLCGDRMNLLYEQRDRLKADRDSVVKPLQLAIKRVDDMVNPLFIPIKAAYDTLNKKLGAYSNAKRKQEEERLRQEQEIQAAKLKAESLIKATQARLDNDLRKLEKAKEDEQAAELVRTKPVKAKEETKLDSGVKFVPVNHYKFRIVDEALIPREFLCVDQVAIQKYATAQKEKAKIEGVEFFVETTMKKQG